MRNAFADELVKLAAENDKIVLLSGDIGNRMFDKYIASFPSRFKNCGVAEANMMGVAAGLAMSGLRPITYTITPFTTSRCFEQIRVDACYHNVPVIIVGVGAGLGYATLGPTHHSCEDIAILRSLPNMKVICPADAYEVRAALREALKHDGPVYIRIGKKGEPLVHKEMPLFTVGKGIIIKEGKDVCLLSTGTIMPVVLNAVAELEKKNLSVQVVSFHTVKPLDEGLLKKVFTDFKLVVTIEEHSLIGGFGSAVAEWLSDNPSPTHKAQFLRLGTQDKFMDVTGEVDFARDYFGLTAENIVAKVGAAINSPENKETTTAAVLVEIGKPLQLTTLTLPELKPGQVLVEMVFSGICHTQVSECRGRRGEDKYVPHCLGHEGSGIVKKIGNSVQKVKPGDKVIVSWMKGHGADIPGTVYQWDDKKVNAGGVTTFQTQTIVSENRLTLMKEGLSMEAAALLGCAVPTGLGSIFNTAQPKPGQSIAVFGTGGIGLCALAGALIIGCYPIIAVDINDQKLQLAKEMGATHFINPARANPIEEIKKIQPQGLDYAIESSGIPDVMNQALESVRSQGGTVVIIGNAPFGKTWNLNPWQLNQGKRILGTWGGDNLPERDFPRYMDLILSGKLKLDFLKSKTYSLEEINQAIDDLEIGKTARPLIDLRK